MDPVRRSGVVRTQKCKCQKRRVLICIITTNLCVHIDTAIDTPDPTPPPHSLPGLHDAPSNGRAGSGSSAAAPKRRHFGCRSALEQITLTPPPRGDCIRDTCNYEIWRVMKGESMSPRREFQRWTRRREHGGESNRVKSFSGHPRGRDCVLP